MTSNESETSQASVKTAGKGRPTRSRKEAQAARRRPLVATDRKEARRRDREKRREIAARQNHAMMTGDEKNMPYSHRGKERRFVRDLVDSRHNIGEYFVPVAFVFMLVALIIPLVNPNLYAAASTSMLLVMWGGIALVIVDSIILRKKIRREVTEKFGSLPAGIVSYGVMRAIQIRPWRLPKPMVKHGGEPVQPR